MISDTVKILASVLRMAWLRLHESNESVLAKSKGMGRASAIVDSTYGGHWTWGTM